MDKLDYQSQKSTADPSNLEYEYGCMPALIAIILAGISIALGAVAVAADAFGLIAIIYIMAVVGWVLALKAFNRPRGKWLAMIAMAILLIPTLFAVWVAVQLTSWLR